MKRGFVKKGISLCMAGLLASALFVVPASALENTENIEITNDESIAVQAFAAPRPGLFTKSLQQAFINLTIDSQGNATGSVSSYSWYSTDKLYVTATLQKHNGSDFYNYSSAWTGNGTGAAFCSGTTSVSRGTYRVAVSIAIYDSNGKYIEIIPGYSPIKAY